MKHKNSTCKAKLDYPCQWLYKVVGTDHDLLHQAITEIISDTPCNISLSNSSSSGKYLCLNLEITVQSEKERNSIFASLKEHPHVKIVL